MLEIREHETFTSTVALAIVGIHLIQYAYSTYDKNTDEILPFHPVIQAVPLMEGGPINVFYSKDYLG